MRTINFIAENQKVAVVLSNDSNAQDYLSTNSNFEHLEVQFNKKLNIAKVNGLSLNDFLAQNPAYNKSAFKKEFKYCCIPAAMDGNFVTLNVSVEHNLPKNTNVYSLISGDLINREIKGELGSDDVLSQVKEAIADFEFYSEDVKSRKYTSLVFELKYFRFTGEQFPVRVEDLSGEHAFTLEKSSRLVYEFDFDNAEELMSRIAQATSITNERAYRYE